MRYGWAQQPDIVVDQVLQLRCRDARFIRTRAHFVVPRFDKLLKLKRQDYPLRRIRTPRF